MHIVHVFTYVSTHTHNYTSAHLHIHVNTLRFHHHLSFSNLRTSRTVTNSCSEQQYQVQVDVTTVVWDAEGSSPSRSLDTLLSLSSLFSCQIIFPYLLLTIGLSSNKRFAGGDSSRRREWWIKVFEGTMKRQGNVTTINHARREAGRDELKFKVSTNRHAYELLDHMLGLKSLS